MTVLDEQGGSVTASPTAFATSMALVRQQWPTFVFFFGLGWLALAVLVGLIGFEPVSFWVPLVLGSALFIGVWMRAASFRYAVAAVSGAPISVGSALAATLGLPILRFSWTGTLVLTGTIIGTCALIVPGVWFYLRYGVLAAPVVITEGLSGIAALRRARELSIGRERTILRDWLWFMTMVGVFMIASLIAEWGGGRPAERVLDLVAGLVQFMAFLGWRSATYAAAVGAARPMVQVPGLRPWVALAPFTVGLVLLVSRTFIQAFWIPSGAMLPTIAVGDHVFVRKFAFEVKHGEIVVFRSPIDRDTILIKRVAAMPGDEVEIRAKQLLLNGQPIAEPHAYYDDSETLTSVRDQFGPRTVPEGKFFVLGDNRDRSYDSRFYGFADLDDVIGVVTWIYWSWDKDTEQPRLERIGKWIR